MKVFVASSGRCGTGYLHAGFNRFTGMDAFHEAHPVLMGSLLKEANSHTESKTLREKAKRVAKHPFYMDAAHQFMRGFYTYVLEEIPTAKVIKLARNPLEVARSRINRDVVPGKNPWLGDILDDKNVLRLSEEQWQELTDFQKILWDWLEHEDRFDRIKDELSQIVYVSFEALTKNSGNTFKRIFKELGIKKYKIDTIDLYRNQNLRSSMVQPGDQQEFDELVSTLRKSGYEMAWLNTDFYQRVVKRHDLYVREVNLLPHYNKHPNYSSVSPSWALNKFPIKLTAGMRILDLGCGDGRWSRYIKEHYGCTVVGVDFSEVRIKKAKAQQDGISYHCANAYDFVNGYTGPKFDYVLMVETLEHLENPEALLTSLKRIARNIFGTVPKNFPYVAHLQVYKTATEFRDRFPDWKLQTMMGKAAATDKKKNSIFFYTKES